MKSVSYIDDFLDKDSFLKIQQNLSKLSYTPIKNDDGLYGHQHILNINNIDNFLLKKIKDYFFPNNENLKPVETRAHLRHNKIKVMPHLDDAYFVKGNDVMAFILYVKGDSLLHNGTGFYGADNNLNSFIGFQENRALFFNGAKIWHTDLQFLGKSSPRYTLNIFYESDK
jgi:hypothetical protein